MEHNSDTSQPVGIPTSRELVVKFLVVNHTVNFSQ